MQVPNSGITEILQSVGWQQKSPIRIFFHYTSGFFPPPASCKQLMFSYYLIQTKTQLQKVKKNHVKVCYREAFLKFDIKGNLQVKQLG